MLCLSGFELCSRWVPLVVCEYSCFSSLLIAGLDVLPGGMSAPQRQKFRTDDINQCLHIKSGSRGFPK